MQALFCNTFNVILVKSFTDKSQITVNICLEFGCPLHYTWTKTGNLTTTDWNLTEMCYRTHVSSLWVIGRQRFLELCQFKRLILRRQQQLFLSFADDRIIDQAYENLLLYAQFHGRSITKRCVTTVKCSCCFLISRLVCFFGRSCSAAALSGMLKKVVLVRDPSHGFLKK